MNTIKRMIYVSFSFLYEGPGPIGKVCRDIEGSMRRHLCTQEMFIDHQREGIKLLVSSEKRSTLGDTSPEIPSAREEHQRRVEALDVAIAEQKAAWDAWQGWRGTFEVRDRWLNANQNIRENHQETLVAEYRRLRDAEKARGE